MFSQLRLKLVASIGLIALLGVSSVWAQVQPPQQPQRPQQPPVQESQAQQQQQGQQQQRPRYSAVPQGVQQTVHNDAQLAAWLIVDNQNEIALVKMAQERAKSDDVKAFAQKARDDHQQLLSRLQQFAGTMGAADQQGAIGTNPRNEEAAGQGQNQNNPQVRQPVAAPGATAGAVQQQPQQHAMGGGINFVALKRELGAQCLQTAEKELGQKSGKEFDECFIGMQIGMHYQAEETMMVFKHHASPALQQVLDDGIRTAQSHLKHAKDLMKEMKDEKGSKSRSESSGSK